MKKIYIAILLSLTFTPGARTQNPEQDSVIFTAIGMLSIDSLQSTMQSLQDMGTRFMIAANRKEVATWILNRFSGLGVTEVRLDSFQCYTNIHAFNLDIDTTTWQYNVEARIEGWEVPEQEVVLIGHYDDYSQDGDPMLYAPGADDNASGTAVLFEIARVIQAMGYQPRQTLVFLASAAEELMYYGDAGTEHYAAAAADSGRNIIMAINNDMIAWDDGTWSLSLFNHIGSPHITALAIDIIETYTTLGIDSWDPVYNVGGDIQPFLNEGYCGIYFMEHYINENYHTDQDLVENCDFGYFLETTKVTLGCVLRADLTVGIDEFKPSTGVASIYPNPSVGEFNVLLHGKATECLVRILNTAGEEVYGGILQPGLNHISLGPVPPGIYVMMLQEGSGFQAVKLAVGRR